MLWVAFRWHGLAPSAPALYRAALQRIDSVPLCYEQTFLSDGRARFHPLSKKGRSAVWLAWIGCGLHILQISTAASAYRRFLIDTLDSSLRCQHQYTQLQKIFWNNQCLGALKLFCYHLVKWHFQPFLACDLLQKSHKKHYSYSYRATLLHQNLSGYFIKISTFSCLWGNPCMSVFSFSLLIWSISDLAGILLKTGLLIILRPLWFLWPF